MSWRLVFTLAFVCGCSADEVEPPIDSGVSKDSGVTEDTGVTFDSGSLTDSGTALDGGVSDVGLSDTGPLDTGDLDAGALDTGDLDAGDAGLADTGIVDCVGTSTGAFCTTCAAGLNCAGCFGGVCLDSRVLCSDILSAGDSTGDGIYDVRPSATSSVPVQTSSTSVFCDMTTDGGGWTMVYKKTRLDGNDGRQLWAGTATNADDLTILDKELAPVDYSNAFQVDYWGAFTEARVEVVTGTVTVQWIQFDLVGTDNINWFAPDRHTASSWTDLPTDPNFDNGSNQAFRIGGGRTFYINRLWGGCPADRGWLMISTVQPCFWEVTADPADIIYSRLTTESHIPNQNQTGYADTVVILLR